MEIKEEPIDHDLSDYMAAMEKQAIEKMLGERKGDVSPVGP